MAGDVASAETQDPVPDREVVRDVGLHQWRRGQLRRLGVPPHLAEVYAGEVDWHEVATLVDHGCDPIVAVDILR